MFRAKLYAIGAAVVASLLALLKIVLMQRNAAREDARRAKKHINEVRDIRKVEKEINAETKAVKKKAAEAISRGEVPDNIRDRNRF